MIIFTHTLIITNENGTKSSLKYNGLDSGMKKDQSVNFSKQYYSLTWQIFFYLVPRGLFSLR